MASARLGHDLTLGWAECMPGFVGRRVEGSGLCYYVFLGRDGAKVFWLQV